MSVAYDLWRPGPNDDCTAEIHNSYSVVGPDGKLYPTWHPPIDPATGCHFGHEHGRDPRGSNLYKKYGPIPFGYANEQLAIWDPTGIRNEDHFGHKIEWENNVTFNLGSGVGGSVLQVQCDVLTKLHQGTHSKDAFTNNLHELVYYLDCTDGTRIGMTIMTAIGTPARWSSPATTRCTCTSARRRRSIRRTAAGSAPSPTAPASSSSCSCRRARTPPSARRCTRAGRCLPRCGRPTASSWPGSIPTTRCSTPAGSTTRACPTSPAGSWTCASPPRPTATARHGWLCDQATANGTLTSLPFDDPRSPFNGVKRQVDINGNRIANADGPEVWYTDPFGGNAKTTPFPGSIRQVLARMDNTESYQFDGPTLGGDRDYGGQGVHAPN